MRRWILALAVGLLSGCDVATAALLLGTQNKSSSDDDAPLPSPDLGFGPNFKAWVADIADAPAAEAQRLALMNNDGNPTAVWTEVVLPVNEVFDPSALPGDINAILIQVSSSQNYELDCVEVLDAQDLVIDHASGTTWHNLVTTPDALLGPPDGVTALTAATGATRAFIFTLFTNPAGIEKFRINGHKNTQPPDPGDVVAVGGGSESFLNEWPGGMAIDSGGLIHVTLSIGDTGRLSRYSLAGVRQNFVEISTDLATAGSHSVALNSAGVIFTSSSFGSGLIQVRRFESDLTEGNVAGFSSGFSGDRVEHNSIAVDSEGHVVVVGGFSSLISGRNHFRVRMPDTLVGTDWQVSTSLDNGSVSYWHAVTTDANAQIYMTGDLRTNILSQTHQVYSSIFELDGDAIWEDELFEGEAPDDVGHAIALDGAGNIFVGGSFGTDLDGKDCALVRYPAGGGSGLDEDFAGAAQLNDEILDVAVGTDGAIYAVGYTTVAGQGENWWIRKYVYVATSLEFNTVWTRTHHGGFGNDRAVSCAIHGNNLVVAGYETNSTAQTKFVLRVYEK